MDQITQTPVSDRASNSADKFGDAVVVPVEVSRMLEIELNKVKDSLAFY